MGRLVNARTGHIARWVIPAASRLLIEAASREATMSPLARVAHIEMGQSPRSESYNTSEEGVSFIGGPSDLGLVFPKTNRWTNSPTKLSQPGDIIICVRATIGEPRWSDGIYCLGRGVAGIRPTSENLNRKFLFRIVQANEQRLREQGTGTTFKTISKKHIAAIPVPMVQLEIQEAICNFLEWLEESGDERPNFSESPPLPGFFSEQRRIVARIEELAAKVEAARALRQQAVEEAESLVNAQARKMLSAVGAEITELRDWLDPNRNGVQTGPFGSKLSSSDFIDTGVPVLTIGNVQYNGLALNDLKYVSHEKAEELERYTLENGDILFARMGTVGRCCVVPKEAEGWLINYHIIRVALDQSQVEPRYIHWIIQTSADVSEYLEENIRGATRAGVNSRIVGSLPCRVPPLVQQRRIVAYLDDLQAKVEAVKQHQAATGAALDALLPSVLDRAFKGEL